MLQIVSNPMLPGKAKPVWRRKPEHWDIDHVGVDDDEILYDEWVALQWSEMDWFS